MVKKSFENIREGKRWPDRIYRGRILKAVREHPLGIRVDHIGPLVDEAFDPKQDTEWIEQVIRRLMKDELDRPRTKNLLMLA